jgi:hypothetical protein
MDLTSINTSAGRTPVSKGSQEMPHPIVSSGLLESRAVPRTRSGVGRKLIPVNLKLLCDYLNRHSAFCV